MNAFLFAGIIVLFALVFLLGYSLGFRRISMRYIRAKEAEQRQPVIVQHAPAPVAPINPAPPVTAQAARYYNPPTSVEPARKRPRT